MLPASLAAAVPVFIATPTSAWASAGRVVGAVAGHRHQPAFGLLLADDADFVFRFGLGDEIVDTGLVGDRFGGQRVVAGDHDRADAHRPQFGEALLHARFDGVLEIDHARARRSSSTTASGVPPSPAMRLVAACDVGRHARRRDRGDRRRPRPSSWRAHRCAIAAHPRLGA